MDRNAKLTSASCKSSSSVVRLGTRRVKMVSQFSVEIFQIDIVYCHEWSTDFDLAAFGRPLFVWYSIVARESKPVPSMNSFKLYKSFVHVRLTFDLEIWLFLGLYPERELQQVKCICLFECGWTINLINSILALRDIKTSKSQISSPAPQLVKCSSLCWWFWLVAYSKLPP